MPTHTLSLSLHAAQLRRWGGSRLPTVPAVHSLPDKAGSISAIQSSIAPPRSWERATAHSTAFQGCGAARSIPDASCAGTLGVRVKYVVNVPTPPQRVRGTAQAQSEAIQRYMEVQLCKMAPNTNSIERRPSTMVRIKRIQSIVQTGQA